MIFGIVYAYRRKSTNRIVYVGKATGTWTLESTLNNRHKLHLSNKSGRLPFDLILQKYGEKEFNLLILKEISANTSFEIKEILKSLEKEEISKLRPEHNVVFTRRARVGSTRGGKKGGCTKNRIKNRLSCICGEHRKESL